MKPLPSAGPFRSAYLYMLMPLILIFSGIPASYSQQYNFVRYSLGEGLVQSQVEWLYEDSKGYLWLGYTNAGISRFDGKEFQHFNRNNGLDDDGITHITESDDGQLWLASDEGAYLFTVDDFTYKDTTELLRRVLPSNPGDIEIIGYERAGENDPLLSQTTKPQLHFKGDDHIWAVGDSGIRKIENPVQHRFFAHLYEDDIFTYQPPKNDILWTAKQSGLIEQFDVLTLESNEKFPPPVNVDVTAALFIDDENIWLGTRNNGIFEFNINRKSWTNISESQGLSSNQVSDLLKDQWGNIWLATKGGGIVKYLGKNFTHFDQSNGLHGNKIYALCEDHNGRIWISASNNGIALFDGTSFTRMERDDGYIDLKSKAIYEDDDNNMWIGTQGGGIVILDSEDYSIVTISDGLPSSWINNITSDRLGNILVSSPASGMAMIYRRDSITFKIDEINQADGLPDNYISTLKRDNLGQVWYATQYGRVGYLGKKGMIVTFDEEDGLPGKPVNCLAFDQSNNIYIGTKGKGIYYGRIEKTGLSFEPMSIEQPLISSDVRQLIFDESGRLYAGTDRGLYRFTVSGAAVTNQAFFGKNEGFFGIETNNDAVIRDDNGELWFGTMDGLTRHLPSDEIRQRSAPVIHFEDISLFYESLADSRYSNWSSLESGLEEGLELPYQKNHLSFDFKAIHLRDPESIKYQWRLSPIEKEWSPLSSQSAVNYTNLEPGIYQFEVRAASGEELYSTPISANFTILQPIWQNRGVQVLAGVILLLLFSAIIFGRINAIRKKEKRKRDKLELENQMLQLEQKALQLQMNPHFIFNTLNSIQSLVARQETTGARSQINKFAVLMRSILSNAKKEMISLEEEVNTLTKFLELEQFCQPNEFEFTIDTGGIDLEETEIPPMLIQPFVENAIIHGVSHLKDRKGRIELRFRVENGILQCSVEDNGVGRKKGEELRQSKKPGHQSIAMDVNRQRLEALNEDNGYSACEVIDLTDAGGNASGTKVVIRLPYENRFN